MPDVDPILPTPGEELLHVPPPTASVSVVVAPVQTDVFPDMAAGAMVTVTVMVASGAHPVE